MPNRRYTCPVGLCLARGSLLSAHPSLDWLMEAAALLDRIRAIPPSRRIRLPDSFSQDAAGKAAADILRMSAESKNDILLLLPPGGSPNATLMLAELLQLPETAPTIGVLCGAAATTSQVLLQACTIRGVSRHAELSLRPLDFTHSMNALRFSLPDPSPTYALEDLSDAVASIIQKQETMLALIAARTGISQERILATLATKPDYSAAEAVAAGWADVVI